MGKSTNSIVYSRNGIVQLEEKGTVISASGIGLAVMPLPLYSK